MTENVNDRVQEVLSKSALDSEFRAGLLTNPRATLERMAGEPMPENLRVKFIEKDSDCDAMFVLPDPISSDELTDQELEAVAGGIGNLTINLCNGWTYSPGE